jgi:maleate isomerase
LSPKQLSAHLIANLTVETTAMHANRTVRLGMLTPSSNTVLEPVTSAMLAGLDGVTAHFSRFKVTEIALSETALRQFDDTEILRAAELLAHAKVDVIAWNGTSASWLGFDRDEWLAERIKAATGVTACTCVLGYRDILQKSRAANVGIVSPYTDDVQARIVKTYAANSIHCGTERHLGLSDNFSFAEVTEQQMTRMVREVARDGCDAIAILCTNMRGAPLVAALEREIEIPIYDSVAVTLWACLKATGIDTTALSPWGRLFATEAG